MDAFDADVIINAWRGAAVPPGQSVSREQEACIHAVSTAHEVGIPSCALFELTRAMRPEEEPQLKALEKKMRVLPVDDLVVTTARDLFKQYRAPNSGLCPRCLCVRTSPPPACRVCGLQRASDWKRNDMLNLACAVVHGAEKFVTMDSGVISIRSYRDVQIVEPGDGTLFATRPAP